MTLCLHRMVAGNTRERKRGKWLELTKHFPHLSSREKAKFTTVSCTLLVPSSQNFNQLESLVGTCQTKGERVNPIEH